MLFLIILSKWGNYMVKITKFAEIYDYKSEKENTLAITDSKGEKKITKQSVSDSRSQLMKAGFEYRQTVVDNKNNSTCEIWIKSIDFN